MHLLTPRLHVQDEFRQFFVRYNEPPHIKHLKVGLLPLISNASNARDIASELGEVANIHILNYNVLVFIIIVSHSMLLMLTRSCQNEPSQR